MVITQDNARRETLCGGMMGVCAAVRASGSLGGFLPIFGIAGMGGSFLIGLIIDAQTSLIYDHAARVYLLHQSKIVSGDNNRRARTVQLDKEPEQAAR